MSEQIKRLSDLARQALEQYTHEISAGGEPVYPDWTNDLKAVVAEREQLLAALKVIESHLDGRMMHQADNPNYRFWNQLWDIASEALAAAGAP